MRRSGSVPKIFKTDQGSQFTGHDWIFKLEAKGIAISMDVKRRCISPSHADSSILLTASRELVHNNPTGFRPIRLGETPTVGMKCSVP